MTQLQSFGFEEKFELVGSGRVNVIYFEFENKQENSPVVG